MDHWLDSGGPRIEPIALPGGDRPLGSAAHAVPAAGAPAPPVVLTDVSKPLRDEERAAWQRLIRVLGHELNNSLAPIKSIAGSLGSLVQREPRPSDWEVALGRGLGVIATRAEALSRFMTAYAQLARLPAPTRARYGSGHWSSAWPGSTAAPGRRRGRPDLTIEADADQIEQP